MQIHVQLSTPRTPRLFAEWVQATLDAIAAWNERLASAGAIPPLYGAGVSYRREPEHRESFSDALIVSRRRFGDCADLSAYRAGELRAEGEPATIRITWAPRKTRRGRIYHVTVRRADGSIEDPSKVLGMKG